MPHVRRSTAVPLLRSPETLRQLCSQAVSCCCRTGRRKPPTSCSRPPPPPAAPALLASGRSSAARRAHSVAMLARMLQHAACQPMRPALPACTARRPRSRRSPRRLPTLRRWFSTRRCRWMRTYLGHLTKRCMSFLAGRSPPMPASPRRRRHERRPVGARRRRRRRRARRAVCTPARRPCRVPLAAQPVCLQACTWLAAAAAGQAAGGGNALKVLGRFS